MPRSAMCTFRFRRSELQDLYLLGEEDELTEDGHGLEILSEGPAVVGDDGAVEVGVEDGGHDCCENDEVVALDHVEILVVAGAEGLVDCIEDVAAEGSGKHLLYFEDGVSGGVERQVTLVEDEDDGADGEDDSVADEGFPRQPAHRSRFADLEHDEREPECLHGARQREQQRELAIAKEDVRDHYDCSQNAPRHRVLLLDILHYVSQIYNIISVSYYTKTLAITQYTQYPTPNTQYPIPNAQYSITNTQHPLYDSAEQSYVS